MYRPSSIRYLLALYVALAISSLPETSVRAQIPRSLEGPYAEGAFEVARHPDGFLVAAARSGVFRSDDGGSTWHPTANPPAAVIRDLTVLDSGDILLLAGDGAYSSPSSGAYRSSDGGATWSPSGLAETGAYQLASDGSDGVYAASNQAVYRSSDSGLTWHRAEGNGLMTHDDVQRVILTITDSGWLFMTAQLFTLPPEGGSAGRRTAATTGRYRLTAATPRLKQWRPPVALPFSLVSSAPDFQEKPVSTVRMTTASRGSGFARKKCSGCTRMTAADSTSVRGTAFSTPMMAGQRSNGWGLPDRLSGRSSPFRRRRCWRPRFTGAAKRSILLSFARVSVRCTRSRAHMANARSG